MDFVETILPWTGFPVRWNAELRPYLEARLPSEFSKYLPASVSLYVDPEIGHDAVAEFCEQAAQHLRVEMERRRFRQQRFVKLGLMSEAEMKSFLTGRTAEQPWAIYYGAEGGLGLRGTPLAEEEGGRGMIPCSSMQNHGVAWARDADGSLRTWLATSRRPHSDWDFESDIGHESAHAAFAQVPFFVQSNPVIPPDALSSIDRIEDLTPVQIAQIVYLFTEIAVVSIRGEDRPTATGLPVASTSELLALLHVAERLIGDGSFEVASAICKRLHGVVHVNQGDEIYQIATPILRTLPRLTQFVNDPLPPSLERFLEAVECPQAAS